MKKCNHHKKIDSEIPAWLWFPIFGSEPCNKWTDQKETLALVIKEKLKEHLRQHDLVNHVITEPNNFDALPICESCHKKNESYRTN